MTLDEVRQHADKLITPMESYAKARESLVDEPPGFLYVFALTLVDADIKNGGISQLYSNPTWTLMPDAIDGASAFGLDPLAQVLREIVYYYHRGGRSKLKRRLSPGYFANIPADWAKTLDDLENDFYARLPAPQQDLDELLSECAARHDGLFRKRDHGDAAQG